MCIKVLWVRPHVVCVLQSISELLRVGITWPHSGGMNTFSNVVLANFVFTSDWLQLPLCRVDFRLLSQRSSSFFGLGSLSSFFGFLCMWLQGGIISFNIDILAWLGWWWNMSLNWTWAKMLWVLPHTISISHPVSIFVWVVSSWVHYHIMNWLPKVVFTQHLLPGNHLQFAFVSFKIILSWSMLGKRWGMNIAIGLNILIIMEFFTFHSDVFTQVLVTIHASGEVMVSCWSTSFMVVMMSLDSSGWW